MPLSMNNVEVFNLVRSAMSLSAQERIPEVTKGTLARTFETLSQYEPIMNEFLNVLIQRIGLTIFQQNSFENKLAPLKRGNMYFGGAVQELQANLLNADSYDPDDTNPFDAPKPDVKANYYTINRRDKYAMKYNEDMLKEAFISADDGLSTFINMLLALPTKSDQWDEYVIMRDLISGMYNAKGLPTVQIPNIATSTDKEADGKTIAQLMRQHYLQMRDFYNTQYNVANMQVSSDELILLGTPAFFSNIDVNVLAVAFNINRTELLSDWTIVVDDFNIAGCDAVLIDRSAYVCTDSLIRATNIYNPSTLEWIMYLHHWGTYALSDMRNILMFNNTATTNLEIGSPKTVTSVALALTNTVANNAVLEPGAMIQLTPTVTYSDTTTDEAVYYIITDGTATAPTDTSAPRPNVINPDSGTYVDPFTNILHVSPQSTYDTLTVTAYSAVNNTKLANLVLNEVGYSGK